MAVTERIRRAGQVAWAVVGLAVIVALVGTIAWYFRVIWPPIILAGAIVFVLNPVVTFFHHRRVPRAVGAGLSYLAVAATVAVVALITLPIASDQADELEDELPHVQADVERWINNL